MAIENIIDESRLYMMRCDMNLMHWSVESVYQKWKNGMIDFDISMQRGAVWDRLRESLYIHSLLLGLSPYQPPFLANRVDTGNGWKYEILDGKQRGLTAVSHYLNNDFKLVGLEKEPYINYNGNPYNVNGKYFNELPPDLQLTLKDVTIPVAITYDATPEQKSLIFLRANNSKEMTPFDKARAVAKSSEIIERLSKHNVFKMLYDKVTDPKEFEINVVKTYIVDFTEYPTFKLNGRISRIMKELEITPTEEEKIQKQYDIAFKALTYLYNKGDIFKIIRKEGNFLSWISFADKFPSHEKLAEWLVNFYGNTPKEYLATLHSDSGSVQHIKQRLEIVRNSVDKFLTAK